MKRNYKPTLITLRDMEKLSQKSNERDNNFSCDLFEKILIQTL